MQTILILFFIGFSLNSLAAPGDISAADIRYPVHLDYLNAQSSLDFDVSFALKREIERNVETSEIITVPLCLDIPVDPTKGDWKSYWDATPSTSDTVRAQALSVAVKGLNQETALLIVKNGLFLFRPRYWSEFVQQIQNAQSALIGRDYQVNFADAVTIQFGSDNAHSLGFWSDANCRMDTVTRKVIQKVIDHVPAGIYTRHYSLRVQNAVFQDFESDNFNLNIGYDANSIDISGQTKFNNYTPRPILNSNGSVTIFLAARRNKVDIPDEAIETQLLRTQDGFSGTFKIDEKYLPKHEPESTLMLDYEVCASWLFGCKTIDESKVSLAMTSANLTVAMKGPFESGSAYRIRYRFYRTFSKYYRDSGTDGESNKVDY